MSGPEISLSPGLNEIPFTSDAPGKEEEITELSGLFV